MLRLGGSCAAHLALAGRAPAAFAAQAAGRAGVVVSEQPWGRLERVADGVWALDFDAALSGDPNARRTYVDAIPSQLSRSVRALTGQAGVVHVPGHGVLFAGNDLAHDVAVIDAVEEAARRAHGSGTPAAEAAKTFALPPALGEWTMFGGRYAEVALSAWERELRS